MSGRVTITMPLGIGDCHWVMQRMTGFRKYIDPDIEIHAHIAQGPNHKTSGFLELTSFFDKVVNDPNALVGVPADHRNPRWATLEGSANWRNFDFCFQANGHLESGLPIETWLPELDTYAPVDYNYPLKLSTTVPEPRILLYPSGIGPNRGFKTGWGRPQWDAILKILNAAGHKPTFVGADTPDDMGYWQDLRLKGDFEDLVGKTSVKEYVELILSCRVWYGLNSGGGILAGAYRRNTVMLWGDETYGGLLHPKMARSWLGPEQDHYHVFPYGKPGMETDSAVKLLEICDATR